MKTNTMTDKQEELVCRKRAYKAMNPDLRSAAKEISALLVRVPRGEALIASEVGRRLNEIASDEGIYGQDAVALLADYLPLPQGLRTLMDYRKLAAVYDRETLEALMKEPMANGRPMSLYHFVELASVSFADTRAEMIEHCRRESLSVAELRNELVSRGLRSCLKKNGGRQVKAPVSLAAGLHRLSTDAERLVKYAEVFEKVCEGITEMPPAEIDANLLDRVNTAASSATSAIESLETVMEGLKQAKARVERVLSLRAKDKAVPVPA